MKFIDCKDITLRDLINDLPSGLIIVTQEDKPVIVMLSEGKYEQDIWADNNFQELVPSLKRWNKPLELETQSESASDPLIKLPDPDSGILEVSMAISGIAIAAIFFATEAGTDSLFLALAIISLSIPVGFFSAYGALWELARILTKENNFDDTSFGFQRIKFLVKNLEEIGPYLLVFLTILCLVIAPIIFGFPALVSVISQLVG